MHFQLPTQFLALLVNTDSGIFATWAGLGLIAIILAILTSIFWVWMLIDCATSTSLDSTQKLVWILVILFAHFIGALIYFFVDRGSARGASPGR